MKKGVSTALWVLQFLLAVLFVASGWAKLISKPELVAEFAHYDRTDSSTAQKRE